MLVRYLGEPTELPFTKSDALSLGFTKGRLTFLKVKQKRFWINETQICGTGCCQGHDATILEKIWKDWKHLQLRL
jgi:hypothetical protein